MRDIKLGHLLSFSAGIRGNNPVYVHGVASSIDPVGPDGWYGLVDEYALGIQEGNGGKGIYTRTLWCAPGEGYSYSTASIHDVSIMLRNLTRSEEHTSKLQSLMCNSYVVFCLKKTNKIKS